MWENCVGLRVNRVRFNKYSISTAHSTKVCTVHAVEAVTSDFGVYLSKIRVRINHARSLRSISFKRARPKATPGFSIYAHGRNSYCIGFFFCFFLSIVRRWISKLPAQSKFRILLMKKMFCNNCWVKFIRKISKLISMLSRVEEKKNNIAPLNIWEVFCFLFIDSALDIG